MLFFFCDRLVGFVAHRDVKHSVVLVGFHWVFFLVCLNCEAASDIRRLSHNCMHIYINLARSLTVFYGVIVCSENSYTRLELMLEPVVTRDFKTGSMSNEQPHDFLRFLLSSWLSKYSCNIRAAIVVLKLLRLRAQDYDVTGVEHISSYSYAVEIHRWTKKRNELIMCLIK